MTALLKKPAIICCLFLMAILVSCNTTKNKKMDDFISVTVQKKTQDEVRYALTLNTKQDSTIYAVGYKEELKGFSSQVEKLKEGREISIKGTIYYIPTKKGNDRPMIVIQKIKFD